MDEVLEAVCARQAFLKKKHSHLGIDTRFCHTRWRAQRSQHCQIQQGYKTCLQTGVTTEFFSWFCSKIQKVSYFIMLYTDNFRAIPPMLRENTDIAVVFRQFTQSRIDACWEVYLDFIEEKKRQREFLLKHTTKKSKWWHSFRRQELY